MLYLVLLTIAVIVLRFVSPSRRLRRTRALQLCFPIMALRFFFGWARVYVYLLFVLILFLAHAMHFTHEVVLSATLGVRSPTLSHWILRLFTEALHSCLPEAAFLEGPPPPLGIADLLPIGALHPAALAEADATAFLSR